MLIRKGDIEMPVILDRVEVKGDTFYNDSLPEALKQAQRYAGKKGHVATMPQLLHGRVVAPFEDEIWANMFTALTEESDGTTQKGKAVLAVAHGGGILCTPKRILKAYRDGLIDGAAKLSDSEFRELDSIIPVFSYRDLVKGRVPAELMRYAAMIDFRKARETPSGVLDIDSLYENPLFIMRAGGVEAAQQYLDKLKQKGTIKYGNHHHFQEVDPAQARGRLVFLGGGDYVGLGGDFHLDCGGRFAAVKG